jgi:hypothetical protein
LTAWAFRWILPIAKKFLNKQEDISKRKEVKEEEAGSGNSRTDSVNSGSGSNNQKYTAWMGP